MWRSLLATRLRVGVECNIMTRRASSILTKINGENG